jgi:hypothetical protein
MFALTWALIVSVFAYFGARKAIDRLVTNLQSAANAERRFGDAATWGPIEDRIAMIRRRARICIPVAVLLSGTIGAAMGVLESASR